MMLTFFCLATVASAADHLQPEQQEFLESWYRHDRVAVTKSLDSFAVDGGVIPTDILHRVSHRNILPNIFQGVTITYLDEDFAAKPELKEIIKERKYPQPKGGYLLLSIGNDAWNNYLTFPTSYKDFSRLYYRMKDQVEESILDENRSPYRRSDAAFLDSFDAVMQADRLLQGFPSGFFGNLFVPLSSKASKQARALQIEDWLNDMIFRRGKARIAVHCLLDLLHEVQDRNEKFEVHPTQGFFREPLFLQPHINYFVDHDQ